MGTDEGKWKENRFVVDIYIISLCVHTTTYSLVAFDWVVCNILPYWQLNFLNGMDTSESYFQLNTLWILTFFSGQFHLFNKQATWTHRYKLFSEWSTCDSDILPIKLVILTFNISNGLHFEVFFWDISYLSLFKRFLV